MSEYLVLRITEPSAEQVEWISVGADGVCQTEPRHDTLETIAEAAANHKVIALAPAFAVLRTTAQIPVRGAGKLLKALPFAMEEQLAEDVEDLHFSMGKHEPDGRLPVAVVRHSQMESWLADFTGAGLNVTGLFSDGDALGDIPGTTVLLVEPDRATLRDIDGSVSAVDRAGLEEMLDLWLAGRRSTDEDETGSPVNLLVYTTPNSHEGLESIFAGIHPQVDMLDIKLLPDGSLPRMAAQIAVNPGIDLMQADFARRSNLGMYWPIWRTAAILLLCVVGTIVGVKAVEIARMNSEADALDAAIEQAFRYTFPDIGEIRDPRAQLESKLRTLGSKTSGANPSQFLDTLETVAAAISASKDVEAKLETINYRSGVMELRVRAPNVNSLDTIQKAIVKDGDLSAEIQSANPEGDKVLGRIQVKGPGA